MCMILDFITPCMAIILLTFGNKGYHMSLYISLLKYSNIRCQETIGNKICSENVLDLLIELHRSKIQGLDLETKLKTAFFDDFEEVNRLNPDLEDRIHTNKDLMTKLFQKLARPRRKSISRKVTFVEN